MALISCSRLGSRSMLATLNRLPSLVGNVSYASAAAPKIVYKQFQKEEDEHHDVRNARLNRPLSPHLTHIIFHPQLTSMLSITHRATGMLLSGYFAALGIGALVLPHDISHYIAIIQSLNLSPATLFLAKAIIAAPLGYHFANGIRHLVWDTAKGLTIKQVYASGYTMLACAAIITLGLAAL